MGLLFIYDNKPSQSAWRVRTSRRGSLERYGRAATLRVRNPPDLDVKGLVGQWTFFKLTASLHVGWQAAKSWRYAFSWWSCPSLLRSCQVLVGLVIFFFKLVKTSSLHLDTHTDAVSINNGNEVHVVIAKELFHFFFLLFFLLSSPSPKNGFPSQHEHQPPASASVCAWHHWVSRLQRDGASVAASPHDSWRAQANQAAP